MLKEAKKYYCNGFYHHYFIDDYGIEQGPYKIMNTNGDLHTTVFLKDSFYQGVAKCYLLEKTFWFKTCTKSFNHGIFIKFNTLN